jgi:ribonuclease P/MRP protein subunit POP3
MHPSTIRKRTESPKLEDPGSVTLKEQVCHDVSQIPSPPAILDSLEIGLNEVTRALERSITTLRSCQYKKQLPSDFKPISLILVCLADINPPNLVVHIPHLVSVYNSMLMTQGIIATKKRLARSRLQTVPPRPEGIKLVTLPKNAESSLAGSIGLRRISVVAFYVSPFYFPWPRILH